MSICDPAQSSYGVTEWDAACTPYLGFVQVTAKSWNSIDGHPRIDFEPALRFVPSTTVTLEMRDKQAANPASDLVILYCTPDGCVDEAMTDPSVATQRNNRTGFVFRRVKHFSSYTIALGFSSGGADEQ